MIGRFASGISCTHLRAASKQGNSHISLPTCKLALRKKRDTNCRVLSKICDDDLVESLFELEGEHYGEIEPAELGDGSWHNRSMLPHEQQQVIKWCLMLGSLSISQLEFISFS